MRGSSYFVFACFVMAMVCLSPAQLGLAGKKGRTGLPGIPSMKHCPVDSKITTFLRQLRTFKTLGQNGILGQRGPRSTGVKWPYNCLHAGLNYQAQVFEVSTYECCAKCEVPHFSRCMGRYSRAQARCSSEAIRCIAQCISKKGGGSTSGRPGQPGPGGQKCSTNTKYVGGSYCLQTSCINV